MPRYFITLDGKYMDGWQTLYRTGDDPVNAKWVDSPDGLVGLTSKTSDWALYDLRTLHPGWKRATISAVFEVTDEVETPKEQANGLHEDGQSIRKEHRTRKPRVDGQSN